MPVPAVRDLDELNAMLLTGCQEDLARIIDGRQQTIGEALAKRRSPYAGLLAALLSLAGERGLKLQDASTTLLDEEKLDDEWIEHLSSSGRRYGSPLEADVEFQESFAAADRELFGTEPSV